MRYLLVVPSKRDTLDICEYFSSRFPEFIIREAKDSVILLSPEHVIYTSTWALDGVTATEWDDIWVVRGFGLPESVERQLYLMQASLEKRQKKYATLFEPSDKTLLPF